MCVKREEPTAIRYICKNVCVRGKVQCNREESRVDDDATDLVTLGCDNNRVDEPVVEQVAQHSVNVFLGLIGKLLLQHILKITAQVSVKSSQSKVAKERIIW